MNHHSESQQSSSTTSAAASPNATRKPQQHNLGNHHGRTSHGSSVIRHTPPSAYPPPTRTPISYGQQTRFSSHHNKYASPQHLQHYYGSPFASPPPTARKPRGSPVHQTPRQNLLDRNDFESPFVTPHATMESLQKHRPERLILDPNTPSISTPDRTPAKHTRSSIARTNSNDSSSRSGTVTKLFQAATQGISPRPPQHHSNHNNLHATPSTDSSLEPASIVARTAAQAGFLHKLGKRIPEFKRRFFVLKAETRLYYYLSPNDTEPRGKIDLEGSTIEPIEELPDGRFRFAVVSEDPQYGQSRIVLESRTKDVGLEWMKGLKQERVSTLKENLDHVHGENRVLKNIIQDLEKQIDNFRMMEKDRDGALEDARKWKQDFLALDEAIRGLTQHVRKPPVIPKIQRKKSDDDELENDQDDNDGDDDQHTEEEKKDDEHTKNDPAAVSSNDVTTITSNQKEITDIEKLNKEIDFADMESLKDVPGTYFSSLSNACQQQRELFRLASIEAATAVEDVVDANQRVQAMEKRMEKAEKHLTKLWEENCSIRKNLRQRKQEKKLLVKEVKSLQQANKELEDRVLRTPIINRSSQSNEIDNEGERLINELEDHVSSSIRLHERLLAGSVLDKLDNLDGISLDESVEVGEIAFSSSPEKQSIAAMAIEESEAPPKQKRNEGYPNTPGTTNSRMQSLFDDDESEGTESEAGDGLNEYESVAPTVSSAGATMGDIAELILPDMRSPGGTLSPPRQNPLLKLDENDDDDVSHLGSTTSDVVPKSKITDNGQATSRLVCPLADVVESKKPTESETEEFSVYHISFYSQKIGIQFQKAPPAPKKARGLLTDAMTADLDEKTTNSSGKTAAELTTIASIHSSVASGSAKGDDVCVVADPKDVVLVCGFEGFDDSNANRRPKLGARLVAFDGISVEVGPWTFDSIRKAIKARGRPLTLSFRNDFLTTEQRAVLTKAVNDMGVTRPPPVDTIPRSPSSSSMRSKKSNQMIHRGLSRSESVTSARSHEYDHFVNESPRDMLNISDAVNPKNCCHGSAPNSLAGSIKRVGSLNSDTGSARSNLKSFSETGSSTISAAVAPLVAKLMKGVKSNKREKENYTPVYLQRSPKSLESTPQHQDFRANLL